MLVTMISESTHVALHCKHCAFKKDVVLRKCTQMKEDKFEIMTGMYAFVTMLTVKQFWQRLWGI